MGCLKSSCSHVLSFCNRRMTTKFCDGERFARDSTRNAFPAINKFRNCKVDRLSTLPCIPVVDRINNMRSRMLDC